MQFGETELVREKGNVRLLKIGAKYDREVFCVIGNGSTLHYEDYDDALEEFNRRWLKEEYGE